MRTTKTAQQSHVLPQNIEEAISQLRLEGCTKINVFYRKRYVTVSCIWRGHSSGKRGTTLAEAIGNVHRHITEQAQYWGISN